MKHIKKYYLIAKTSLQNNLAYSASFVISSMFYVLIIFTFFLLWRTIYSGGNTISGYTLKQIIWYCIITEMILGPNSKFFNQINEDIKSGNIAYLLNKPYQYIFYLFSNNFGEIVIKLVIKFIAGITLGFVFVGPIDNFKIMYIPFIIISIILAILLNFFLLATIALTTFWFEENEAFYWINSKITLMLGVFMPIDFFPEWLRNIVKYLPHTYFTYAPAKNVVDFSFDRYCLNIVIQITYLIFFILLSLLVYQRGVKKLNVNGG